MNANTAGASITAVNFDSSASPAKAPAASHQRASPLSFSRTSAQTIATANGISATSNPRQYAGSASYGLRPSRWTLGRRAIDDTSVATRPSMTSEIENKVLSRARELRAQSAG